jgi:hypothetical protein
LNCCRFPILKLEESKVLWDYRVVDAEISDQYFIDQVCLFTFFSKILFSFHAFILFIYISIVSQKEDIVWKLGLSICLIVFF